MTQMLSNADFHRFNPFNLRLKICVICVPKYKMLNLYHKAALILLNITFPMA